MRRAKERCSVSRRATERARRSLGAASFCYISPLMRSTKIVATLGPSSSESAVLERMIRAGVDVVRLNFSHGVAADHEKRASLVKELATRTGRTVAILCDLQGPKIRVGKFKEGKINLEGGQSFILDAGLEIGDRTRAGLDYKELPRDVAAGAVLL